MAGERYELQKVSSWCSNQTLLEWNQIHDCRVGADVQLLTLIVNRRVLGQLVKVHLFEVVDSLQELLDELFEWLEIASIMLLDDTYLVDQSGQIAVEQTERSISQMMRQIESLRVVWKELTLVWTISTDPWPVESYRARFVELAARISASMVLPECDWTWTVCTIRMARFETTATNEERQGVSRRVLISGF